MNHCITGARLSATTMATMNTVSTGASDCRREYDDRDGCGAEEQAQQGCRRDHGRVRRR